MISRTAGGSRERVHLGAPGWVPPGSLCPSLSWTQTWLRRTTQTKGAASAGIFGRVFFFLPRFFFLSSLFGVFGKEEFLAKHIAPVLETIQFFFFFCGNEIILMWDVLNSSSRYIIFICTWTVEVTREPRKMGVL